MRCLSQNPGENTHAPAFARFTCSPSGNVVLLCKRDLDWWLDDCDEGICPEPSALTFLTSTRG